MQQQSYLSYMFSALGIYAVLLPLAGLAVFAGACLVVTMSRRPSVIAAYLVFLPLPLLLGIFGTIQGFISSYMVIATAGSTPKPSDMATGISAGLFASLVGLMATFPGYFVVAIGLFIRTLQARSSPPAEYQDS